MAIKINNVTVIDDSLNLSSIETAFVNKGMSITDNSISPALEVLQTGSGFGLKIEDVQASSEFTIDNSGQVVVGGPIIPSTSSLVINESNTVVSLGLKNLNPPVNTVYGHSISVENGRLHFKSRTNAGFTTTYNDTSVLSIGSDNRVGIRTNTPGYNLDVRGRTAIIGSQNSSIQLRPNDQALTEHMISSSDYGSGNMRQLGLASAVTRFYTGTGQTANQRMAIDQNGNPVFTGGTLFANRFMGPGADWALLGNTTFSNTANQVNFAFEGGYTHYVLFLKNVNFATDTDFPAARLYDMDFNIMGSGTYFTMGTWTNSATAQFGLTRITSSSGWFLAGHQIPRSNSNSSVSSKIIFYNPVSSERNRRIIVVSQYNTLSSSVLHSFHYRAGGSIDIPSSGIAQGVNLFSGGASNFFSGSAALYGIR